MKRMVYMALGVAVVFGPTGCMTPWPAEQQRAVKEAQELETLKVDLKRLQERVEQLATAQQDAYQGLEKNRTESELAVRRLREDLRVVQDELKALQAVRARDKEEIIEVLSKQIAGLLKSQSASTTKTERGIEHVVRPGETLSSIAALYGKKPAVIIEANQIKDPNHLRIGTKLFIPEAGSGR